MVARTVTPLQVRRRKRTRRLLDLLLAVAAMGAANLLAQAVALHPLFLIPALLASGSLLAWAEARKEDDQ